MNHKNALDRDQLIQFVLKCWDEKSGAPTIPLIASPLIKACEQVHSVLIPDTMHIFFRH